MMDPNAPVTTQQVTQVIVGILVGVAVPWVVILPAFLLIMRWWDRRALRLAKARWVAWEATHPREPPRDNWERRWQLRQQLWLESQPAYLQAHLLRAQLDAAEREAQVEAILAAEPRGEADGR
jgi:hypothetical protein